MKEFVGNCKRFMNDLRICKSLQVFEIIRKNATCTSICKEFARICKKL